jgi:GntR family transcriptional regulator
MAVTWSKFEAKRGSVPVYVQLADFVEARIRDGSLADGDQIPSERALSELVGHAAETVGKAKKLLVERGLASTGRGLGTFVTAPRDE